MRAILIFISLLFFSSVQADPPGSTKPSALYLCTYCMPGEYTKQDDFFNSQIQMFRATSGKMISVGSSLPNADVNQRAKAAGMPLEKSTMGDTPLKKYRNGTPEDTKYEMAISILNYLKQLDRSKPITIHIADHGWNGSLSGSGSLPPERAGIMLKTQTSPYQDQNELILTHEEFSVLLQKAGLVGEGAPPVRIVAEHCYGGGVHWISEKFPNVCTAAFTSVEEPNYTSDNESVEFWKHVDQNRTDGKKTSLTEAFYSGWSSKSNSYSEGGALGSTQYIRGLLKKNGIDGKKLAEDTLTNWSKWEELSNFQSSENACQVLAPVTPLSSQKVSEIQKIMATIAPDRDSRSKEFTAALEAIQKTGAQDQRLLREYELRFKAAQNEWNKLSLEQKAIQSRDYTDSLGDFFTWMSGDFESSKKIGIEQAKTKEKKLEADFLEYKRENLPKIQTYLKNRELLARMGELNKFSELVESKKITQSELKNYQRMVACESLPL